MSKDRYVVSIEFIDGTELKASSSYWGDIELFLAKWMDKPWKAVRIFDRQV